MKREVLKCFINPVLILLAPTKKRQTGRNLTKKSYSCTIIRSLPYMNSNGPTLQSDGWPVTFYADFLAFFEFLDYF